MNKPAQNLWIIDDDELFIFYTNRIIEIESLAKQVRSFKNAMSALCCLEDNKDNPDELPDIILLDIYMPFQDGFEFYHDFMEMKPQLKKDIRLYITSCSLAVRDLEKVKTLSAVTDFIIKPLTASRLKDIVDENVQKRILIVDDETDFCFLLCKMLNLKGYQVNYVTSFDAARSAILENRYHLAFLDYNLEDGYGTELLPFIRTYSPDTSVVMISGSPDPAISKQALQKGANFFINKPLPNERIDFVLENTPAKKMTA
jgi:DNA-binding NtrC family response regulator